MASDNNLNNELCLFYDMMTCAFEEDDIIVGMNKSLKLLENYLDSDGVILFRKSNESSEIYENNYSVFSSSSFSEMDNVFLSFINNNDNINDGKNIFNIDLDILCDHKNIVFLRFFTKDYEYILAICNYDMNVAYDNSFFDKIKKPVSIIAKKAELYEKNLKLIYSDVLTGLNNRNSYEERISNLKEIENNLVFGLFDLFRLKYVNDNYSHAMGDRYIVEAAHILKKYWPTFKIKNRSSSSNCSILFNCLYRVGGDEFVLLSNSELIESSLDKAKQASEEVSSIDLGVKLFLGLNYGIVYHNSSCFLENTYMNADEILSIDKKKMYKKLGLERRK